MSLNKKLFLGAVIIFTAIFSKFFVNREVTLRHWLGIITIILGLATVGASDFLQSKTIKPDKSYTPAGIILGIFLIFIIIYTG